MNVGNYVRTKEFGINRIKWFDNEEPILENGFTALQNSGYKSSPQIIDLIEVGDYVNGVEVINIDDEWITMSDTKIPILKSIANGLIKTVVTHEQMEAMEYRVEE